MMLRADSTRRTTARRFYILKEEGFGEGSRGFFLIVQEVVSRAIFSFVLTSINFVNEKI